MDNFPDEIVAHIADFLTIQEFYEATTANKQLYSQRAYEIQVFEVNKRRQRFSAPAYENRRICLIIFFHNDKRCVKDNPDLHFIRQKNLKKLHTHIRQYDIQKIRYKGLWCPMCNPHGKLPLNKNLI